MKASPDLTPAPRKPKVMDQRMMVLAFMDLDARAKPKTEPIANPVAAYRAINLGTSLLIASLRMDCLNKNPVIIGLCRISFVIDYL